jgi:high-affinity nickel-transport protein
LGLAVKWLVEGVVSENGALRTAGALVGTSVSGLFLVAIGVLNLLVFVDLMRAYGRVRARRATPAADEHLLAGGLMARAFGRWFRVVRRSWQMYPVGFVFGLGFDTASEIALLAISAGAAANRLPFLAVVSLPVIFAAGMTLMDTADGAFMSKAYAWAFSNPIRKLFYNLTITAISVFVALFVGAVELSQIAIQLLGLHGAVFDAVSRLELGSLGLVIAVAFVVVWALAFAYFKLRHVEERWGTEYAARRGLS